MNLAQISGAVLAGGHSSRFLEDKSRFVWHGKTLLEHSLAALEGCAERFVVGGPALAGFRVYPDAEPFKGSLYGLMRALELAQSERVALAACDMPNLSAAYWAWLAALEWADVVVPLNVSGLPEPLAALYTKACLPAVRSALEAHQYRLAGWWDASLRVRRVPWPEIEHRFTASVFLNANTKADLER